MEKRGDDLKRGGQPPSPKFGEQLTAPKALLPQSIWSRRFTSDNIYISQDRTPIPPEESVTPRSRGRERSREEAKLKAFSKGWQEPVLGRPTPEPSHFPWEVPGPKPLCAVRVSGTRVLGDRAYLGGDGAGWM